MFNAVLTLLRTILSSFKVRRNLVLENLALRHRLMVIRRQVERPRLTNADRSVWILLRRLWSDWDKAFVLVKPAIVIAWHRAGFRAYWR
jgi:putative transposase